MRIGVVSDTHDSIPPGVLEKLTGCQELWHLGDVTLPSVLDEFLALGIPLHVVRGNCDTETDWPLELDLVRGGIRFRLRHIPPLLPPSGVDVLLHGHTHVPRDETIQKVRFLNPGTLGKPNKGAPPGYAILTVDDQGKIVWDQRGI